MSIGSALALWRCLWRLRREGFHTLVYLVPSERTKRQRLRDQIFFRLAGIKRVLAGSGFSDDPRPRLPNGNLAPLPKEADSLLHRLGLNGIPVPEPGRGCSDLGITEKEQARVASWWQEKIAGKPIPDRWFVLCTGGKTSTQLWPLDRYVDVVRVLIKDHGLIPVIIGGSGDRQTAADLLAAWGCGLSAAGELNVRESAALLTNARFYLGNDTGVMHLAAAVGLPCVAVFSSRNAPGMWEPYGPGHKIMRFEVPCAGCTLAECPIALPCLTNISVKEVYAACCEVPCRASSQPVMTPLKITHVQGHLPPRSTVGRPFR